MTTAVVFGRFGPAALEGYLLDGLRSSEARAWPLSYAPNPGTRVVRRALWPGWEAVARRLDRRTMKIAGSIDLVLCMKPATWGVGEVRALRATHPGAVLACYLPDDPEDAHRGGHFRRRAVEAIGQWDVVVTWTCQQSAVLEALGARSVAVVPFGWAPEHRVAADRLKTVPTVDVAFVGSWDADRERVISSVAARVPDAQFLIRGPRWSTHGFPQNVTVVPGPVFGDAMIQTALGAKVSMNIPRRQNVGNHNMRYFELAAMGAVQVAAEPIGVTGRAESLAHPVDDLEAILRAAKDPGWLFEERSRIWASVAGGTSYRERAAQLLDLVP